MAFQWIDRKYDLAEARYAGAMSRSIGPWSNIKRHAGTGILGGMRQAIRSRRRCERFMKRSAADAGIERVNPLKRIGRKMNPIPFAMFCFFLIVNPALAQHPPVTTTAGPPSVEAAFEKLPGRWVRLQGGYVITIRAVDADGKLDASYANPRSLPFHVAVANWNDNTLKLLFELRAGGYNGSTYTLSYDAANDRLIGVYDQVVVKQKFDVVFVRDKS
jgi:hypothetical protein